MTIDSLQHQSREESPSVLFEQFRGTRDRLGNLSISGTLT